MIGRQVSHFYIIRMLGSGGMGVVYEAQDTRLPRSVAIKFLKPALSRSVDALKRFKREARLASSLNHPNICTILDVDDDDGQSFIVMELLQGRSLKARMGAGPPRARRNRSTSPRRLPTRWPSRTTRASSIATSRRATSS